MTSRLPSMERLAKLLQKRMGPRPLMLVPVRAAEANLKTHSQVEDLSRVSYHGE